MIRIQQVDTLMAREQPHVEDLVDNQRPLDAEGFPRVKFFFGEYIVSNSFSVGRIPVPILQEPWVF